MNTPVKQYTVQFVSDGVSQSVSIDCSIVPVSEEFRGNIPLAVLLPAVSSTATGPIANVTAQIAGTTVTLNFAAPLPKLDTNSNLIIYTATFYLQYGE